MIAGGFSFTANKKSNKNANEIERIKFKENRFDKIALAEADNILSERNTKIVELSKTINDGIKTGFDMGKYIINEKENVFIMKYGTEKLIVIAGEIDSKINDYNLVVKSFNESNPGKEYEVAANNMAGEVISMFVLQILFHEEIRKVVIDEERDIDIFIKYALGGSIYIVYELLINETKNNIKF